VNGLQGVNQAGADYIAAVQAARAADAAGGAFGPAAAPGPIGVSVVEAAQVAAGLSACGVWFLLDADVLLADGAGNVSAVRAVCNLRDRFESDGRCVVLLGGRADVLSSRLAGDCFFLAEPKPDVAELRGIVSATAAAAQAAGVVGASWSSDVPAAADALRGLNRFAAKQAAAVVLSGARKLDPRGLWDQKNAVIRASRGLIPEWGGERFADLAGQDRISWWADVIMREKRPSVVVRIEELEKIMQGAGTESTGTASDALAVLLQSFEDYGWSGLVALGPGGSGKSGFSKALGATYNLPCYRLDLGAMRGHYLGDSEGMIRDGVETIRAMGGADVFAIASCNALINIPGPLLRRFRAGIWFFDLPDVQGRRAIVEKQARAHGLDPASFPAELLARPYSGAEIRNLCALVRDYRVTWADASTLITPLYVSDASTIARLRSEAKGRYLDAARVGFYGGPSDGPGAETVAASGILNQSTGRAFSGGV
jgi:hypothetical protein